MAAVRWTCQSGGAEGEVEGQAGIVMWRARWWQVEVQRLVNPGPAQDVLLLSLFGYVNLQST